MKTDNNDKIHYNLQMGICYLCYEGIEITIRLCQCGDHSVFIVIVRHQLRDILHYYWYTFV